MRAALLLADPDPHEPGYLERNLSSDGFDVVEAGWSAQALDIAERSRPDIVLAGEAELCARLREGEPGRRWDRNVPVIVLTAAGADPVERVRAFERGADDVAERELYPELVARIHAVLRRAAVGPADVLEVGELVVDRRARQVRVRGVPVSLAGREFDLAVRLASDPTGSSRRTSSCARSGATGAGSSRAPWTRTRRGCATSCAQPAPSSRT